MTTKPQTLLPRQPAKTIHRVGTTMPPASVASPPEESGPRLRRPHPRHGTSKGPKLHFPLAPYGEKPWAFPTLRPWETSPPEPAKESAGQTNGANGHQHEASDKHLTPGTFMPKLDMEVCACGA